MDYHKERLFKQDDKYTNKLLSFYGANASGKTTILKSIVWFAYYVSNANQKEFPNAHSNIYTVDNLDSFIELSFLHEEREFIYRLDLNYDRFSNIKHIKNEILKIKADDEYQLLFDREKGIFKNLSFEQNDSLLFDALSSNSSLLNESRSRMKDYRSLFNFFHAITGNSNISGTTQIDLDVSEEDMMALTFHLFNKDNFEDLFEDMQEEIDKKIIENSLKFGYFLFEVLSLLGTDIKKAKVTIDKKDDKEFGAELGFAHEINLDKYLDFELESNGTKTLIKLIYKIFDSYQNNSILIIDELDALVHPLIVPILNLLTIKLNVQMIYSTHNISNMKYLYNDEIYLIEKDEKHNTIIKTLKDYEGYENFEKLYRNGLLGGVPNIENINFDFIDDLEN
jgi:hypothetical protein